MVDFIEQNSDYISKQGSETSNIAMVLKKKADNVNTMNLNKFSIRKESLEMKAILDELVDRRLYAVDIPKAGAFTSNNILGTPSINVRHFPKKEAAAIFLLIFGSAIGIVFFRNISNLIRD